MTFRILQYWTGVGSRETPPDVLQLMTLIAKVLTDKGMVLRSGGADGADSAFYAGAKQSRAFYKNLPNIYISWNGMTTKGGVRLYHDPEEGLFDAQRYPMWKDANILAHDIRGSWQGLGGGGIAHHTRNIFQILGHNLDLPSKFVVFWAIPVGKQGNVRGGTNTAVKFAKQNNINVHNLHDPLVYNKFIDFLDKHQEPHNLLKKAE